MASAPEVGEDVVARWRTPSGGGWRFGTLTGDFNGIHWWSRYARAFGFRRAFHHPQLVLGQSLAHIPKFGSAGSQRLDAWIKGPVYHGSEVSLRATAAHDGTAFAVVAEGERRPAIVGRWRTVAAGTSLLEDDVRAGVSAGRDDDATLTTPRDGAAVGSTDTCDGRGTSS